MKRLFLSALAVGLCGTAAGVQPNDTDEYDGRWTVVVRGDRVGDRAARLTIGNYAGTWLEISSKNQKKNPCLSKKPFPITVQQSKPTELEFMVWVTSILPGCSDFSVTVKPVDPKTLEGSTADGLTVRLTRK